MSWSVAGANNMAKILALKASGRLYDMIQALMPSVVSERLSKKYTEVIAVAKEEVEKVKKKVRSVYAIRRGQIPYTGCAMTEGRKVIKELVSYKKLGELI
ncbi:MAG: hypothetical protein FWJ66_09355 [Caldibacillus sp.]